jgi:hypothetical protein
VRYTVAQDYVDRFWGARVDVPDAGMREAMYRHSDLVSDAMAEIEKRGLRVDLIRETGGDLTFYGGTASHVLPICRGCGKWGSPGGPCCEAVANAIMGA